MKEDELHAGTLSPSKPGKERVKDQIKAKSRRVEGIPNTEVGEHTPLPTTDGFYFLEVGNHG